MWKVLKVEHASLRYTVKWTTIGKVDLAASLSNVTDAELAISG